MTKLCCIILLALSYFTASCYSFASFNPNLRWISRRSAKVSTSTANIRAKPKKILQKDMFSTDDTISKATTSDTVTFTIYGEPQALERHRTLKTGMTYNPSASKQQLFRSVAMRHLPSTPFNGTLEVSLTFYFVRPKNHFGTGSKSTVLKPQKASIFHTARKDLDNLVKFVLDSLNKVAYGDDAQIAMISAAKLYANQKEDERVEVKIRQVDESDKVVSGNFAS